MLPAPLFGSVRTTGRQPGDNATYQCNTGFELIGLETRVCREIDSGTVDWDGEEPVCRRMFLSVSDHYIILYITRLIHEVWLARILPL